MTSNPRQFQGYVADRQEWAGNVQRGDADPGRLQGAAPAPDDAQRTRGSQSLSRDDLAGVSNLSISSWYAISGTAMA
jgi:hypothetical protein